MMIIMTIITNNDINDNTITYCCPPAPCWKRLRPGTGGRSRSGMGQDRYIYIYIHYNYYYYDVCVCIHSLQGFRLGV